MTTIITTVINATSNKTNSQPSGRSHKHPRANPTR